jgi:hypothetical protein
MSISLPDASSFILSATPTGAGMTVVVEKGIRTTLGFTSWLCVFVVNCKTKKEN